MQLAAAKGETGDMWKRINKLAGKCKKPLIKVTSKSHSNPNEQQLLEEWRLYFKGLLNGKINPDTMNNLPPPNAHQHSRQTQALISTTDITRAEVAEAIKQLKANKAPGSDHAITAILLKNGGAFIVD
jgi:hypothetical protein